MIYDRELTDWMVGYLQKLFVLISCPDISASVLEDFTSFVERFISAFLYLFAGFSMCRSSFGDDFNFCDWHEMVPFACILLNLVVY